jgi:hypothetical protein
MSGELPRLRWGAHEFLRRHAASAWEHWEHHGGEDRWQLDLPPDVAALPQRRQRLRVHARQEARRLATAQLFDIDPGVTERAVRFGAAIREDCHDQAVALAGRPSVAATFGIHPPAPSGFARWQGGIGYNGLGAAVIAAHWAPWGPPARQGWWLAWWADGAAVAAAYAAQARSAGQSLSPGLLTLIFGPLWYDHTTLLIPTGPGSAPDGAGTHPVPDGAGAGTPGLVLLYTTLATWSLLTSPGATQLTHRQLPAAEQAADRAAGLTSGPVTLATDPAQPQGGPGA